jgi:hypothetical protein
VANPIAEVTMFKWVLTFGLLLFNIWMLLAIMFAIVDDPMPSTYALAILLALGLTFTEAKIVEWTTDWRAPVLDLKPPAEYWSIIGAGAVLLAVALWVIYDRTTTSNADVTPVRGNVVPANSTFNPDGPAEQGRLQSADVPLDK